MAAALGVALCVVVIMAVVIFVPVSAFGSVMTVTRAEALPDAPPVVEHMEDVVAHLAPNLRLGSCTKCR